MGSTTTFAERVARIESRAARGEVNGIVTPGVVDESNVDKVRGPKTRRVRKGRGGYVGAVLGGIFTSVTLVAVGAFLLLGNVEAGSIEDMAAALLLTGE